MCIPGSLTLVAQENLDALGLISVQPQMHRCTTVRARMRRTRGSAGGGKEQGNDVVEEEPVPTLPAVWFPRFLSPVYTPGRPSLVDTDRRYRQIWQSTPVSYLTRFTTADVPEKSPGTRYRALKGLAAKSILGCPDRLLLPAASRSERGEHKNSLQG